MLMPPQNLVMIRILLRERGVDSMDRITLQTIENDHEITRMTEPEFLYEFQKAVLLALVECGTLTEIQYRCAKEKLRTQFA